MGFGAVPVMILLCIYTNSLTCTVLRSLKHELKSISLDAADVLDVSSHKMDSFRNL